MNKWDYRMLTLAKEIASWSKDQDRQVGAVITTKDYDIVSTGFNGYPRCLDDNDTSCKLDKMIHAEINALLQLSTTARRDNRFYMYIYGGHPCSHCAAVILQSKITHLFCPAIEAKSSWHGSMELAKVMFSNKRGFKYNVFEYLDKSIIIS